jgi:U3 small nucleolar RNA-associated protein 18
LINACGFFRSEKRRAKRFTGYTVSSTSLVSCYNLWVRVLTSDTSSTVPKMPIYSASFLGSTGKVVVSGRRSFFYIYDAVAGKVDTVPRILGRDERSWEKHAVSPDGHVIAFVGNDGYVVLVDTHSKQWIGNLKLNGSVRAITFTPDGSCIIASGSDGDIYR